MPGELGSNAAVLPPAELAGALQPAAAPESGPKTDALTERSSAFSALMDQMDASRDTQGDFFVTAGIDKRSAGEPDGRAMILKKSITGGPDGWGKSFIAITPGGAVEIVTENEQAATIEGLIKDAITAGQIEDPGVDRSYRGGWTPGGEHGRVDLIDANGRKIKINPRPYRNSTALKALIKDSIASADSPTLRARKDTEVAIGLTTMLAELPARS